MKKQLAYLVAVFSILTIMQTTAQPITEYKTDPAKSKVNWIGSKPGGQHHGTVNISEGSLVFEKGTIISGSFTIDLLSITDLDLEPGEWNDKLTNHLKSQDFFYTEKYPAATFIITKSKKIDNTKYSITGDLTIRGITHPVSFDATIKINKETLNATSSEIVLDRVKWDIKVMSKSVFADLKDKYVDDEMRLTIQLVANSK